MITLDRQLEHIAVELCISVSKLIKDLPIRKGRGGSGRTIYAKYL